MSDELRQQILDCPSLPTPPVIAVRLLELTRDPNVRIKDIARLVENDQALAGKVLRLVNSSLYGLSTPCKSIERALGLLGLSTVKSLVLGFSLVESTKGLDEHEGFDHERYWSRVIYSSSAARILATKTSSGDPDEVFTAALFQDMGMMAAHIAISDEYCEVLNTSPDDHEKLCAHELDKLGFSHAEIGAELATKWKLPESIADSIRNHHRPGDAPISVHKTCELVALGRMASEVVASAESAGRARSFADRMREDYGWGFKEVDAMLAQLASAAGEMAKLFEKPIGRKPNLAAIMAEAQELSLEHQLNTSRQAEQYKTEATTDGLTGLHNRKSFDADLEEMFRLAREEGQPAGMIFLDVDKFKSVNDTHGHQVGDAVLAILAERLSDSVGRYGTVYRYGGEEFAALFAGCDAARIERVAELARSCAAAAPFDLRDIGGEPDELAVTISVGAAVFDPVAEPDLAPESLLKRADEQVYAAKQGGRNTVRVFGQDGEPPTTHRVKSQADTGAFNGSRVLLVEDDALAATLVRIVLSKRRNVKVEWVSNGDAAIKKIDAMTPENAPDLLLTDLSLPGANGVQIVERLRANPALDTVKAVVFTSVPDPKGAELCIAAGADLVADKVEIAHNLPRWLDGVLSGAALGVAA